VVSIPLLVELRGRLGARGGAHGCPTAGVGGERLDGISQSDGIADRDQQAGHRVVDDLLVGIDSVRIGLLGRPDDEADLWAAENTSR
jgi:hypothetical protein